MHSSALLRSEKVLKDPEKSRFRGTPRGGEGSSKRKSKRKREKKRENK